LKEFYLKILCVLYENSLISWKEERKEGGGKRKGGKKRGQGKKYGED